LRGGALHRNGAGCSSGTPKAGMGDQNMRKALWIDDDGLRSREGGGQSWGDGVRLIREYGGRGENAWWVVVGYGGRAARQLRANCAVHGGSEGRSSDLGSSTTATVQPARHYHRGNVCRAQARQNCGPSERSATLSVFGQGAHRLGAVRQTARGARMGMTLAVTERPSWSRQSAGWAR
jgi:hypothetical protein